MSAKDVKFSSEARDLMMSGVNTLAMQLRLLWVQREEM